VLPRWVCALLLWLPLAVVAQPAVVINDEHFSRRLTTEVAYLEDPAGTLSIEQVIEPGQQDRFQSFQGDTLQFGYSHSAYWLRVLLHNQIRRSVNIHLEIRYPLLDSVTFFSRDQHGVIHSALAGDRLPLAERDFRVKDFHFPLLLERDQRQWVYVRVQSTSSLSIPLHISTDAGMVESLHSLQWWDGLYFGVAFAMAIYNLSLLLLIRERIYAEYVVFVLLQIGFIASLSGYISVLVPDSQWFINHGVYLFSSAIAVSLTQFTRTFLRTREQFPRWDRVYQGFMVLAALAVVVETRLSPEDAARLNVLVVQVGILLLLPLGIYRYFTGYRPARYFVLGQGVFLSSVMFTTLSSQNILPFYYLAPWLIKIGSVCELMLFSIGLADRISEYKERENKLVRAQEIAQAQSTARETYIDEINQINQRLEQAIHTRSEFLANMSHEIRTPMNGILGMLELIDDTDLDSVQRHYIDIARRSGKTLLDLINDVLDLSKIESGKLELDEQPFSLRALSSDLASLYGHQLRDKKLGFDLRIDRAVPDFIIGDRTRLWQVLTNLISNAIKFTLRGGVQIRIAMINGEQRRLRFSVHDTGIGIAKDKQEVIFESFKQADGTTTRLFGGTGLGLSISRKLVQLMGGELLLHSDPGRGSEFYFELPCRIAAAPEQPDDDDSAALDIPRDIRILLVEDNVVNQKVAQGILAKLGFAQVTVAENGMDALAKLQEAPFDLVFMDVQMPVVDGFEATQRIRTSGAVFAGIPIVAMTANALDGDRERCLAAGMNDYLSKPIQKEALREMLQRYGKFLHPETRLASGS
jgi:signal transduction histidine kinase/CheY-like chemotaxis protein